jgi:hypothetical protein
LRNDAQVKKPSTKPLTCGFQKRFSRSSQTIQTAALINQSRWLSLFLAATFWFAGCEIRAQAAAGKGADNDHDSAKGVIKARLRDTFLLARATANPDKQSARYFRVAGALFVWVRAFARRSGATLCCAAIDAY